MSGKSQPIDAPKVQIHTTDAFGGSRVQQVTLDSNRLRVKTESLQRFSNFVAIPSRGVILDGVLWVLAIAVLIRVPLSLAVAGMSLNILGLLFALGMLPLAFVLLSVALQVPDMRLDCLFRLGLVSLGIAIATRFFWFL